MVLLLLGADEVAASAVSQSDEDEDTSLGDTIPTADDADDLDSEDDASESGSDTSSDSDSPSDSAGESDC